MNKNAAIWGYAGVFPGEFRLWEGDEFTNKYAFMERHGFTCTALSLDSVRDPARFGFASDFVAKHDFHHTIGFACPYFTGSLDELTRTVKAFLEELARVKDPLGVVLVTTSCGPYHRFMREPSLDFQLERLVRVLTPLAAGCLGMGLRLGIENHCDYYLTDLIGLCNQVEGLGIFWDTGNGSMTGENPQDVSRIAAPHVVGTHFKDFFCYPDEQELKLVVRGASLGDGDLGLEKIYRDLMEWNPHPDSLVMEFELIPDQSMHPLESLERSKRFVERISGFPFRYPGTNPAEVLPS
jgi:sugar phosphate isomerase/epimerase